MSKVARTNPRFLFRATGTMSSLPIGPWEAGRYDKGTFHALIGVGGVEPNVGPAALVALVRVVMHRACMDDAAALTSGSFDERLHCRAWTASPSCIR